MSRHFFFFLLFFVIVVLQVDAKTKSQLHSTFVLKASNILSSLHAFVLFGGGGIFLKSYHTPTYTVDPPQVTDHPKEQTNVAPGSDVSFSVTATGTAPLSYQWQKDGVDLTDVGSTTGASITGATTATLTIAGAEMDNVGNYSCVVSNTGGKENSKAAMLTLRARKYIH